MEAVGSEAVSSSTSKASAISCAIEVIVDSTPPKSVHGGDGDRAEFAIQLKMMHTAASSRCFLAGLLLKILLLQFTRHPIELPTALLEGPELQSCRDEMQGRRLACQLDCGALVFVEPFQYNFAIDAAMRHSGGRLGASRAIGSEKVNASVRISASRIPMATPSAHQDGRSVGECRRATAACIGWSAPRCSVHTRVGIGMHRAFAAYSHDEFIEHCGQEEGEGK